MRLAVAVLLVLLPTRLRRLVANLTQVSDQLNRTPTKLLFGDRRKGYEPKGGTQ